jgi:hypothetical protein
MLKRVINPLIVLSLDIRLNLAMTEECIITAAVITSGEKGDGPNYLDFSD